MILDYYKKFYDYLQDLYDNYTKLSVLLTHKLDALQSGAIGALDDIIKQEQVFVMMSKGFDANLAKYRSNLSLQGNTLGEIIDELPEQYVQAFRTLFQLLRTKLDETQQLNDTCQRVAEERLYTLNKAIKELEQSGTDYGKSGNASLGGSNQMFTKTI